MMDLKIAALRQALTDAVGEIVDHNSEYRHVTPKDKLDRWRRLAADENATCEIVAGESPTSNVTPPVTHTFILLEVSDSTYAEIRELFEDAKYEHAFFDDRGRETIDMYGIALTRAEAVVVCDDLAAFVDGESLDAERATAFRAHLPSCETCQVELVKSNALIARISALGDDLEADLGRQDWVLEAASRSRDDAPGFSTGAEPLVENGRDLLGCRAMAETKRTLLERIDRNIVALASLFPAKFRLRFGTPETRDDITTRGTTIMNTLKDNQKAPVTLEVDDIVGNPVTGATFPTPPAWLTSDPTVITVTPAADGLSAVVDTTGKLGTAQVRVDATTADGRAITGIGDAEVVTSGATTFKLVFGEPVDK